MFSFSIANSFLSVIPSSLVACFTTCRKILKHHIEEIIAQSLLIQIISPELITQIIQLTVSFILM